MARLLFAILLPALLLLGTPARAYEDAGNDCGGMASGIWVTCDSMAQARTLSVKDGIFGAKGDVLTASDGVMATASTAFSSASSNFKATDVGKNIQIDGATGNGLTPLSTTIATVVDATHVTLAAPSTNATGNSYTGTTQIVTSGAAGNFIPGEAVACTGGSTGPGGACSYVVYSTAVRAVASVVGAGAGATTTCNLATTTGVGAPAVLRYSVSGGAITGSPTFVANGHFFTNPTVLANEPMVTVNNCGITGVALSINMGIDAVTQNALGDYTAVPSNPVSLGAGGTSGATGATATVNWVTTGTFLYGTDDSVPVAAAIAAMDASLTAGKKVALYFPAGNYLLNSTAMPTCQFGCAFRGDGPYSSAITVGKNYLGTSVLSWHNTWRGGDTPQLGATVAFSKLNSGAAVDGLGIIGNAYVATRVNGLQFYGRNDHVRISDFSGWYIGSCIRGGEVTGGDLGASITESMFFNVRCENSGSTTQPAIFITASGTAEGNNELDFVNIALFGLRGEGFVIAPEASASNARAIRVVNLRAENGQRKPPDNQGDLVRVGSTTSTTATVTNASFTNVWLSNASAQAAGAAFYCAFRVTGNTTINPSNVTVLNGDMLTGRNGGNGLCIDAGSSIRMQFVRLASWNYEYIVGDSTLVASPIEFDVPIYGPSNDPYRFSVGSGSAPSIQSKLFANGTPSANGLLTVPTPIQFGTTSSIPTRIGTAQTTAPALTSCGTGSPAITGTDTAGIVTMGTNATGCVITFNKAYTSTPYCVVTWIATPLASQSYVTAAGTITTTQTSASGNKLQYVCLAQAGG